MTCVNAMSGSFRARLCCLTSDIPTIALQINLPRRPRLFCRMHLAYAGKHYGIISIRLFWSMDMQLSLHLHAGRTTATTTAGGASFMQTRMWTSSTTGMPTSTRRSIVPLGNTPRKPRRIWREAQHSQTIEFTLGCVCSVLANIASCSLAAVAMPYASVQSMYTIV